MKVAILSLLLLAALVAIGVWNSPAPDPEHVWMYPSVLPPEDLPLEIYPAIIDEAMPFVYGVKVSDLAKTEPEVWISFQAATSRPSTASDFSDYSPLPEDPMTVEWPIDDDRSAELELTE